MDFGVVGLDGLVGTETTTTTTTPHGGLASLAFSDPEKKQKWYGSGFLKQERTVGLEDDWRSSKLSKTESMLFQQKPTSLSSSSSLSFFTGNDNGQKQPQMLSFSGLKSEPFSVDKTSQNSTLFPRFHLASPGYNNIRNTGYGSGSLMGVGSMQIGAFTQSQWMELEHQALIYKYIAANVPIPSSLLIPIRKAVESAQLSCFPGLLLRPNSYGWGTFHVGYSGNTDQEPGRCRRTDGKKWRCSRDAVAEQKYCERHINRGRHRSRKPVEGQTGRHSAAATSATTPNIAKGSLSTSSNAAASMVVVGTQGGSMSNSFPMSQQQQQELKNFQFTGVANSSAAASIGRTFNDKGCVVSADSFLIPSHKSSSLASSGNFGSAEDLMGGGSVVQHSLRQFMDIWPNKSQSDCSVVSWPQLDLQSETPELSISIPLDTVNYRSSTSSPNNDRATFSPLSLSREFDPIKIGLGSGSGMNVPNPRQTRWIPISWGASMGGPLGEVLNNNNNSSGQYKNLSVLSLMSESWEVGPRMGYSPTGVLQKTTFGSVSNSSTGSSPRADNNKIGESACLCNDHGSTLLQPSSKTAL